MRRKRVPKLTIEQSAARVAELERAGFEVKRIRAPDGGTRILKRRRRVVN